MVRSRLSAAIGLISYRTRKLIEQLRPMVPPVRRIGGLGTIGPEFGFDTKTGQTGADGSAPSLAVIAEKEMCNAR